MSSRWRSSQFRLLACVMLAACAAGCQREQRAFTVPAETNTPPAQTAMNNLVGGQTDLAFREQQQRQYEDNAFQVSQGETLYSAFNCVGCHAHGGGDVGPALMDDKWVYGGEIDQIYLSIAQGRPNGMPAFAGLIAPQQIWEISAYVRSMGGHGPKSARASRADHMRTPVPQEAAPSTVHRVARDEG